MGAASPSPSGRKVRERIETLISSFRLYTHLQVYVMRTEQIGGATHGITITTPLVKAPLWPTCPLVRLGERPRFWPLQLVPQPARQQPSADAASVSDPVAGVLATAAAAYIAAATASVAAVDRCGGPPWRTATVVTDAAPPATALATAAITPVAVAD